jgi:hypothetical protein
MRTIVPPSPSILGNIGAEESHSTNYRSRIQFGKEKVQWPVTEIGVSSLKKLGKVENVEVDAVSVFRTDDRR